MQSRVPDAIVHCAAYTAVDAAESNPEAAHLVNCEGSGNVARAAEQVDAEVVFISTDYVFNGVQTIPYTERDAVAPLSVYGQSKYRGEQLADQECARSYILRSSWMYGAGGRNFVDTILNTAETSGQLSVIDDQRGCPTWNAEVESFHRTCEDEFYDIETFAHPQAFFDKAATYQLFYNSERTNRNKDNQTPLQLIQRLAGRIDAGGAVRLRPIALGALIEHAYHVPASPITIT